MEEHGGSAPAYEHALASEDDVAVLARLGYKQELRRNFTMIEVFGIAFSIMGLVPSIASTLAYSIPAGPVGMVWGWFLASGLIFVVGLAMADLGSAMPTSGGLYWWTHFFASPKTRNPLCKPPYRSRLEKSPTWPREGPLAHPSQASLLAIATR